ncbi:MAG TPA: hypothetical protein DIT15_07755, partial [Arthrobacter bacterium]|nr:hypothetical protein [Arthrobacter sp.]
ALQALTVDADETLSAEDFEERILVPARAITRARWWIDNGDADAEDVEELVSTALEDADDHVETENPF